MIASLGCQPVSAYSHLVAAGMALASAVPLVRLGRGSKTRIFALTVYVSCVVIAFTLSGAYHSCDRGSSERLFLQRLDYYAIWALIAGTFTAIHGIMWRGFWRGGALAIIWGYAAVGIVLQIFWFKVFSGRLGLALYLGMGWLGTISIVKLTRQIGFRNTQSFLWSGAAFSSGAILESFGWPVVIKGWIGPHEMFHFSVIVGCTLNWLFVRQLLTQHNRFLAFDADDPVERTLITDEPDAESAAEPAARSGRDVAA